MNIGTIRICYIDGTIQEIKKVKDFRVDKESHTYCVERNGCYIFINATQVRYIGRASDIDGAIN